MEVMGSEVASAAEAEDEGAAVELHTVVASLIQAVGCIGERVVTTATPPEAAKLTAQIAEMLLPWTIDSSQGQAGPGADWIGEGAAYGLMRLASGGLRERVAVDKNVIAGVDGMTGVVHHLAIDLNTPLLYKGLGLATASDPRTGDYF